MKYLMDYENIECCECGLSIFLQAEHLSNLRRLHKIFYCPNGHAQSFDGKNEEERLRLELQREKSKLPVVVKETVTLVASVKEHDHRFAKGADKSRRCKLCGLYETMMIPPQ